MGAARKTDALPASAWPKVLQRHLRGERAGAIARDLGCSTAAITGVLRRFRPTLGELAAGIAGASNRLAGVDETLAARLTGAMIGFLETLNAVRRQPTQAAIAELREASDQLMRANARVRLDIERSSQSRGP